jgi:acetyl esterase/lipase
VRERLLILIFVLLLIGACSVTPSDREDIKRVNIEKDTGEVFIKKDVSYGDHPLMTFDIHSKESYDDAPVMFVVHGGDEEGGDKSQSNRVSTYTDVGFVVVNVNYRFSEAEISTTHDIACAFATFREEYAEISGADKNNLLLQAGSAGNGRAGPVYFFPENDWLN